MAIVDPTDDAFFNAPRNARRRRRLFTQHGYARSGDDRGAFGAQQSDMHPALIAVRVFNLAPDFMYRNDLHRQILPLIII